MESGLFVTFFDASEPHDRELPPIGPLDRVVVRDRQLVVERGAIHQADDVGVAIDRWLEAELELQRATGEEPGGTKRQGMRFTALEGVFLRFVVFGDAGERDALRELGPFAVVTVDPRSVEADGQQLASRVAGDPAHWQLGARASGDVVGLRKPDIALRTATRAYHSSIAPAPSAGARSELILPPAPPPIEPPFTLPPREELPSTPASRIELPPVQSEPLFRPREELRTPTPPPPPTPPVREPPALVARDLEHIERIDRDRTEESLRARVTGVERRRLVADEPISDEANTWATRYRPQAATGDGLVGEAVAADGLSFGAALWRMRLVIIGILLIVAGIYTFVVIRSGGAAGEQANFVNVGARFSGTRWDWAIEGVQRVPDAGKLRAQGVFYVVHVAATNKSTEGAQLSPTEFTLIDANGIEHTAFGLGSNAYQGPDNSGSPNLWPVAFPVGKTVTFNILFDIDPSLPRGMIFALADTPKTRVHLD